MSPNFHFSVFSFQFSVISAAALLLLSSAPAAEPLTLPVWPAGAPGKMLPHSEATEAFIKKHQSKNTVTDISEPTITIYRPDKPNGTSVIVAPGGGYMFLSAVHEGTQVCEWLNSLGVTGILLKYRTPTRDEKAPHEKPVQDAQQALKLVREHAAEWQINPKRVGLLGFSAGGNLLAHLACDRDLFDHNVFQDRDITALRPDFGIMIYGGGFLDPKDPTRLAPTFTVPADAPPMFIACAHDDGQNPIAASLLYLEYKKQNLPAELHLFTQGGHGFGMRDNKQPINHWPARCAEWLNSQNLLPNVAELNSEIEKVHTGLALVRQLVRDGLPLFVCATGNEEVFLHLKELQQDLAEARARDDKARVAELVRAIEPVRAKADMITEERNNPGRKVESLEEDLRILEKKLSELIAKRERALGKGT